MSTPTQPQDSTNDQAAAATDAQPDDQAAATDAQPAVTPANEVQGNG